MFAALHSLCAVDDCVRFTTSCIIIIRVYGLYSKLSKYITTPCNNIYMMMMIILKTRIKILRTVRNKKERTQKIESYPVS